MSNKQAFPYLTAGKRGAKAVLNRVEARWLNLLYSQCKQMFSQVKLPSHDHLHHFRVWKIARELLRELYVLGDVCERDIEKVIIAVFFHDVGMIRTLDPRHGRMSRHLCERFFREHPELLIDGLDEVFEAVERHDDKGYARQQGQEASFHRSVLSILSACDDLDAFGAIGVFRYAEIYFLRQIAVTDLAAKVLNNLDNRYRNFCRRYGHLHQFCRYHTQRYHLIKTFYQDLQAQCHRTPYREELHTGPAGVLNNFLRHLIHGDRSLQTISPLVLADAEDAYVIDFFSTFHQEQEIGNTPTKP